jgi:hypothetical protein
VQEGKGRQIQSGISSCKPHRVLSARPEGEEGWVGEQVLEAEGGYLGEYEELEELGMRRLELFTLLSRACSRHTGLSSRRRETFLFSLAPESIAAALSEVFHSLSASLGKF